MEEEQRNIDEFFRQSLADYREAPPGIIWHNIASRLDEEDNGRRRFFFWRWPWVALSILLVVGGAWMVTGWNNNNNDAIDTRQELAGAVLTNTQHEEQRNEDGAEDIHAMKTAEKSDNLVGRRRFGAPKSVARVSAANSAAAIPVLKPLRKLALRAGHCQSVNSLTFHPQALTGPEAVKVEKPAPLTKQPAVTDAVSMKKEEPLPGVSSNRHNTLATASIKSPEQLNAQWIKPQPVYTPQLQGLDSRSVFEWTNVQAPDDLQKAEQPSGISVEKSLPETRPVPDEIQQLGATQSGMSVKAAERDISPVSGITLSAPAVNPSSADVADPPVKSPEEMSVPELRRASYPHSLSLSVLAGYEQSFSMPLNNRFSAAARLLWQVGQDLAIGLQPAFRLGNLTTVVLSPKAVYQQSTIQIDSLHTGDNSPSVRGAIDSIYNYVIQEQFDSIIVKQVSAGGSFWEIELPLTVNYKIGKNLYLFGGPSLNFGGKLTYTGKGDVHTVSTVRKDSLAQSEPLPLAAFNNYFGKSPLPAYSSYQPANTGDPANVRIGYLIGVGYEWNRLLFDASLHQQLSGYQNMAGSLKPIYKRPTVRLSIGYVLFSNRASRPVTLE